MSYNHLLQPLTIGPMTVKNRMAVTAMGVSLAEEDGTCGERIIAYHRAQAAGGVGLVTTGVAGVAWPVGGNQVRQIAFSDDRFIPGMKRLADAVHEHGAKLALQIHFAGLVSTIDMLQGRPLWAPSIPKAGHGDFMDGFLPEEAAQVLVPRGNIQIKVMTGDDIAQLVAWFAAAARRARAVGADGLEIHGGHGYIISSFLSPATNTRSDDYGGSLENRARLMQEIIRAVREAAGPSIAVWIKLDGAEYGRAGGITIEDAIKTAKLAETAGAQAIACTAYHEPAAGIYHSGSNTPQQPELNVGNAAKIKAAVNIPVFSSGRIEPLAADKHIAEGGFDMLYMGRKLLADPALPRKIAEGRPNDILPCIYCYTCITQIYFAKSSKCAVNPETAFERELRIEPIRGPAKRIVVVGGGPAGMESARRLALRGHTVTLLERSDRLGGTLQFASIAYEPNERLLNWLKGQIEQSPLDVRLKTEATADLLRTLRPDEVIVATGAIRELPPIPGADGRNVFSGDDMRKMVLGDDLATLKDKLTWTTLMASRAGAMTGATKSPALIREATRAWMPLGERIVIIGGELVGLELAEFLAHRGRKVTVVDDVPKFGAGLQLVRRLRILPELKEHGVALYPGASDIAIEGGHVAWRRNGQTERAEADHIIVAKGAHGDLSAAEAFKTAGFKVHVAGDANGVGYIEGAMRSAAEIAAAI